MTDKIAVSAAPRPASSTVTTVIFDVGKVLVEWDIRGLYRPLIADPAELEQFVTQVVTPEWHFQHDAGRSFADTSAELIAAHPQHEELIRLFGPRFGETLGAILPGMRALVGRLAARDVPLYAITNFSAEFWPAFEAREAGLFAPFRDILVSGAEKLLKPDPAIYRLAIERFGVAPDACLFVDDRPENVVAAEAQGMRGHVFAGADGLERELRGLGLLEG